MPGRRATSGSPPPPPAGERRRRQRTQGAGVKWTDEDFAAAPAGSCRSAKPPTSGVSAISTPGSSRPTGARRNLRRAQHQSPAARDTHRRWPTGRTASCTCTARRRARCGRSGAVARWVGIDPRNVVVISEYTGGGFGSKGSSSVFVVVPALLSKKANAPVMMRVTRDDEQYIGRARPALHSRVKVGFRKDGRITAIDGSRSSTTGLTTWSNDGRSAGDHMSLSYQPTAMRWRMRHGADQHAASRRAARPGRDSGQRDHRADPRQGGAKARRRSGGDPPDQRAGRQSAVRRPESARAARVHDERVSNRGAGQGRRCSTGTTGRRAAASGRHESARRRRRA